MKTEHTVVFLPATARDNITYGEIPEKIPAFPDIAVRQVVYPRLVWYNRAVQDEAIAQIRAWNIQSVILVGFSKSGLGAWNIARRIPERVSGTIIFDAPMARESLPPWGTAPFYADDAAWQKDLPLRTCAQFQEAVHPHHRLVLISGTGFHDEMCTLSGRLIKIGLPHAFLPRPELRHHWNSGWIEEGLEWYEICRTISRIGII